MRARILASLFVCEPVASGATKSVPWPSTSNCRCCCCCCAQLATLYISRPYFHDRFSLADVMRPLPLHYCTRETRQRFWHERWPPTPCESLLLRLAMRSAYSLGLFLPQIAARMSTSSHHAYRDDSVRSCAWIVAHRRCYYSGLVCASQLRALEVQKLGRPRWLSFNFPRPPYASHISDLTLTSTSSGSRL